MDKTPRTDAALHWADWNGNEIQMVQVEVARQLETDLAEAVAALRELFVAHESQMPPFDMGQKAQDAWAQRIQEATYQADQFLAKHSAG